MTAVDYTAHAEESEAARESHAVRVQEAYQRLFAGKPMEGDAELVLGDLRAFCLVDTDLLDAESFPATSFNLGKLRVWSRIQSMQRPIEREEQHDPGLPVGGEIIIGGEANGRNTERTAD